MIQKQLSNHDSFDDFNEGAFGSGFVEVHKQAVHRLSQMNVAGFDELSIESDEDNKTFKISIASDGEQSFSSSRPAPNDIEDMGGLIISQKEWSNAPDSVIIQKIQQFIKSIKTGN